MKSLWNVCIYLLWPWFKIYGDLRQDHNALISEKCLEKENHYPGFLFSWPSCCWMNLLGAEPQMSENQQRTVNRGTWEEANSGINLPAVSSVSHTKTMWRPWTLVLRPRESAFRLHPWPSHRGCFRDHPNPLKPQSPSPLLPSPQPVSLGWHIFVSPAAQGVGQSGRSLSKHVFCL